MSSSYRYEGALLHEPFTLIPSSQYDLVLKDIKHQIIIITDMLISKMTFNPGPAESVYTLLFTNSVDPDQLASYIPCPYNVAPDQLASEEAN